MPFINEILTDQNISEIKSLANKFGFMQVRLFCVPEEQTLNILVANEPSRSGHFDTAFEVFLSNKFNCVVNVIVESKILKHEINNVLKNSVSIDDTLAIEKIYKKALPDITISPLSEEDKQDIDFTRGLQLAESILNPKNPLKKNSNSLFTSSESKSSETINNEKTGMSIQELEKDFFQPQNIQAAKNTIQKMPSEMVSQFIKLYQEEKQLFATHTNSR